MFRFLTRALRRQTNRAPSPGRASHRRAQPRLEVLERRDLWAGNIYLASLSLTDPFALALVIEGTSAEDTVEVTTRPASVGWGASVDVRMTHLGHTDTFTHHDFPSYVTRITFRGGDGNDTFRNLTSIPSDAQGGAGHDWLYGGSGPDLLLGQEGHDLLSGSGGNDVLRGGDGDDELSGDAGDDELHGGADHDAVLGGSGNDALYGDEGVDLLFGDAGNDRLYGGAGTDSVWGQAGQDELYGGLDDDYLDGGAEEDRLFGEAGRDELRGRDGNDYLDGGRDGSTDFLYGGAGADTFIRETYRVSPYFPIFRNRDGLMDYDSLQGDQSI